MWQFLTVLKAGLVFCGRVGTGLVIAKQRDGSWSAPSAIGLLGLGWGAQIGAELTDFVLLLNSNAAVDAFSGQRQFSLGAEVSVAVGPIGRSGSGAVNAGDGGMAACYSYSISKVQKQFFI